MLMDAGRQALLPFPHRAGQAERNTARMTELGHAFEARQAAVRAAIQRMREHAREAGKMQTPASGLFRLRPGVRASGRHGHLLGGLECMGRLGLVCLDGSDRGRIRELERPRDLFTFKQLPGLHPQPKS